MPSRRLHHDLDSRLLARLPVVLLEVEGGDLAIVAPEDSIERIQDCLGIVIQVRLHHRVGALIGSLADGAGWLGEDKMGEDSQRAFKRGHLMFQGQDRRQVREFVFEEA